jgi:alpha-aminoadipate carrier protein LysW
MQNRLTVAIYNTRKSRRPAKVTEWKEETTVARCPDCDAEIELDEDEVEEGEILTCPECDVELEVVQIHPVQLNLASEEEEDEDSFDDEEDEDEEEDIEEKEADEDEDEDEDEEEE